MLTSHLFYSQLALKSIEPFLKKCNRPALASSLDQFPLQFTNTKYKPSQIKFYEKYLVPSLHFKHFKNLLAILAQPTTLKQSPGCNAIQPLLLKKIRHKNSLNGIHLQIQKAIIKNSHILERKSFQGIFMHRALNMPSDCYSVQQHKETNVIMRMRGKMTRQEHIALFAEKKGIYNRDDFRLEKYYMDGYEKFIEDQSVTRFLVEVNVELRGKVIVNGREEVELPLDPERPITTHLMQIQQIHVPARLELESSLITDIDYFMSGNPYTI